MPGRVPLLIGGIVGVGAALVLIGSVVTGASALFLAPAMGFLLGGAAQLLLARHATRSGR